jgi:hypothetical protein
MGGYNRSNDTFLNVSMGKFSNKKEELSYDGWEGTLAEIKRKTSEWEGKPVEKIEVRMVDEEGKGVRISFGAETYFALGFFARLQRTDVLKPFLLGVYQSKKNEKISLCYIKQNGAVVKGPAEEDEDYMPQPEKVMVGKKEVIDWSAPASRFDSIMETVSALQRHRDTEHPSDEKAPPPEQEKKSTEKDPLPF